MGLVHKWITSEVLDNVGLSAGSPIWSSNTEIFVISDKIQTERPARAFKSGATALRFHGKRSSQSFRSEDFKAV